MCYCLIYFTFRLQSVYIIFPFQLFEQLSNGNSVTYQLPHKREHLHSHLHNTHTLALYIQIVLINKSICFAFSVIIFVTKHVS